MFKMKSKIQRHNKKGFLALEFTIKLVITALCIVILVYVGARLFSFFSDQNDLKKAEGHLNEINIILEGLQKTGEGEKNYFLYSPNEWFLVGWPSDNGKVFYGSGSSPSGGAIPFSATNEIPKLCKASGWEQCFCICKFSAQSSYAGSFDVLTDCNVLGVCKQVDSKIKLIVNQDSSDERLYIPIDKQISENKDLKISLKDNILKITSNK